MNRVNLLARLLKNKRTKKGIKVDNKKDVVKVKEVKSDKVWVKKNETPKPQEDVTSSLMKTKVITKVAEPIAEDKKQKKLRGSNQQERKENDEGMMSNFPKYTPLDMFHVLSQVKVTVPLLEMMRINEHKEKTIALIIDVAGNKTKQGSGKEVKDKEKEKEVEGIVSQIPPAYLGNSIHMFLENITPFFLSVDINGNTLRNYMIDSQASNNVMPIKIMEAMGLTLDTAQGKFYAMDSREVPVVGTIRALPYKLTQYLDKYLVMTILVADIPPHFGMLLSRKWSASMGGNMQCDFSFATFSIDGKDVKIERESKLPHMIEHGPIENMTCFIDSGIDEFRVEEFSSNCDKPIALIDTKIKQLSEFDDLWTMYFDGASSKEGFGADVLLRSPSGKKFRFSFTLLFECTNNVAEFEALLLGLRLAQKHGIKKLKAIGYSELVVSQTKSKYVSKNKRLKQYRNVVWDELESFDGFGIGWMERGQNKVADLLANIAVKPNDMSYVGISKVEVKTRPYVPDNIKNWNFFDNDDDILRFLNCVGDYEIKAIEFGAFVENIDGKDTIFGNEVI